MPTVGHYNTIWYKSHVFLVGTKDVQKLLHKVKSRIWQLSIISTWRVKAEQWKNRTGYPSGKEFVVPTHLVEMLVSNNISGLSTGVGSWILMRSYDVRMEVLTLMLLKIQVFWDVILCQ